MSEIRSSQDALAIPAITGSRSLILRFSLVTAAFAVFLILYVLVSGMLPYRELAMLFMKDPAGFIISAPFV